MAYIKTTSLVDIRGLESGSVFMMHGMRDMSAKVDTLDVTMVATSQILNGWYDLV